MSLTHPPHRQTVSRILALEALPKGIQTEERFVDVAAIPIGIDVTALLEKRYVAFITTQISTLMLIEVRRNPEVSHWVQVLRQRYAGMKLIVGRDKLDEVQVSATLMRSGRIF
jgi:trehalose-6-phosphate synthase